MLCVYCWCAWPSILMPLFINWHTDDVRRCVPKCAKVTTMLSKQREKCRKITATNGNKCEQIKKNCYINNFMFIHIKIDIISFANWLNDVLPLHFNSNKTTQINAKIKIKKWINLRLKSHLTHNQRLLMYGNEN